MKKLLTILTILLCMCAQSYAYICDGVTDNAPELQTDLNVLPVTGGHVRLPAGICYFASPIAYTLPGLSAAVEISGEGQDITVMRFGNGGLSITYAGQYSSFHLKNLTLTTLQSGNSIGLYLWQTGNIPDPADTAQSEISNVTIRGDTVSQYWQYGLAVYGVSNINYTNLNIRGSYSNYGTGAIIAGSPTLTPVVHNFSGCRFNHLDTGFVYGDYAQGITFNQSNFTGNHYGIITNPNAGNLCQLTVTSSQFDDITASMLLQTPIDDLIISNNLFIVENNSLAIQLVSYGQFTISNNILATVGGPGAVGVNGIVINHQGGPIPVGTMVGNNFRHFAGGGSAIWLQPGSSNIAVRACGFYGNSNNVVNQGSGNSIQ